MTKGTVIQSAPIPKFRMRLLEDDGIAEHIMKHGDFKMEQ